MKLKRQIRSVMVNNFDDQLFMTGFLALPTFPFPSIVDKQTRPDEEALFTSWLLSFRSKRLSEKYKDILAELFFLQTTSAPITEFPQFKKNPPPTFLNFVRTHRAPTKIVKEIADLIGEPLAAQTAQEELIKQEPDIAATSSQSLQQKQNQRPPTYQPTPPTEGTLVQVKIHGQSGLTSLPFFSGFIPRASHLSPVRLGDQQQPYRAQTPQPTHSGWPVVVRGSSVARDLLNEKMKQEAWVQRRVQELTKEGLWSLKRFPKVSY